MTRHFPNFHDLFGTSPAAITASADQPRRHAHALRRLGDDLDRDGRLVGANVEGDIESLGRAPGHGGRVAKHLGATGLVTAACLEKFGQDAQHFDTVVARLNKSWAAAHGTKHAKEGSGTDDDATPAELEQRYWRARRHLNGAAHEVARMMDHPQNPDNIRTLMDEGLIPLSAIGDFPKLEKMMIKEVDSGRITDPEIALAVDYHLFSRDGQDRLAHWAYDHQEEVDRLLKDGDQPLNLPPAKTPLTYKFSILDSDELKLWADVTVGTGIMGLQMKGLLSGSPKLTGVVKSGGATSSISDDGCSVKVTHHGGNGDSAGLSIDRDGLWLEGDHKKTTGEVTVVEHAKVRAPEGTPPPAGEPQRVPIRVPSPFAPMTNLVHNVTSTAEDGLSSVGSGLSSEGHHLAHNAEAWGDYLGDKLRDHPEGGGLPTIPGPIPIPIIPAF